MDNELIQCRIRKGQHVGFTFLPAGRQTAQGHEQVIAKGELENETGRVINVTWMTRGGLFKNKIVTKHAPLLRRMSGGSYRFDDMIAYPRFLD
ncbi:hypothetical protein JS541_09675 [Bifidobacterium sp. SO1]|nr:hypothetical protein [Bifidobacterium sp. SO1]